MRFRERASFFAAGLLATAAAACSSAPSFPPLERDAGWECGEGVGDCPTGEVCLQNFCYARCDMTHPCGPRERCSTDGICTAIAGDAGPVDSGRPDPCTTTMCMDPRPLCRNGACLQCQVASECGGATPICDVGLGTCVAFTAAICGPCNNDFDCMGSGLPPMRCIGRSTPDPSERVCLPTCDSMGACPNGFDCDMGSMNCEPVPGTCTGMRAALTNRPCSADSPAGDAECAPAGADFATGLIADACFDPTGAGAMFTCHYPCGLARHCPPPLTCDMSRGFCL
jgi:hypothetical protein